MSRSKVPDELRLTRKDFLRAGALGALGLGLEMSTVAGRTEKPAAGPEKSQPEPGVRVALARDKSLLSPEGLADGKNVAAVLEQALCAYSGKKSATEALAGFIKPDQRVGIKISVMMAPTQPALVEALVRNLMALGVPEKNIIVWDRDSGGYGLKGVSGRTLNFGYGPDNISRVITEESDVLINMPGLKSHWLSGVAGALKNWAGAVTRINVQDKDTPFPFHGDSCAGIGMLGALEPIRSKSRLVILDALRPLYEGGPQVNPAYLWYYGGVFVAADPVAADSLGLELISRKRAQVKGREWPVSPPAGHIRLAETKYRLGVSRREAIELISVGETEGRLL